MKMIYISSTPPIVERYLTDSTAHVPLQRLIAIAWPNWVPRAVRLEIREMMKVYFVEDER